ncbi:hypothetical protein EDD18DRAFT_1432794 [Armillaria luteobubalina]|uniref:F-box domain-containing protein n=1 Tax=Armillaria luteobubalina TaxID=153913 RepID=A0AA39TE46_9AGAR|nr:hypothetical protein EDD18DRAFT_1432794 [Armillaria luteobubalina]
MNSTFYDLTDDVLIYTIAFLSVPDILLLRQVRTSQVCGLRIVWTNAFKLDIVSNDWPFPLDDTDLEHRTRHADRLASRWLADAPLTPKSETSFTGSPVSEIKFVPGRQHKWDTSGQRKCCEWSPKGAIFRGVKLNTEPESEASVAVSLGDVIALDDDVSQTLMYNWKTDENARLNDVGDTQQDHCLQVVRARSISLATPISILIRSQSDNPWALELNPLELYSLSSFPPDPHHQSLRGTAVWIRPHERAMVPHWEEHDGRETLIAAVFPGPLNPTAQVRVREVCMNPLNNWIAFDYDEDLGRIALGSGTPSPYTSLILLIKYNAVIEKATSGGTNIYGIPWTGPPSTSFSSVNQTVALSALLGGIQLLDDQSSSTSITSPTLSAIPHASTTPSPLRPKKNPTGAIVGGVVGGMAVLAIILVGALLLRRGHRHGNHQHLVVDGCSSQTLTPFMATSFAASEVPREHRIIEGKNARHPVPSGGDSSLPSRAVDADAAAERADMQTAATTQDGAAAGPLNPLHAERREDMPTEELLRLLHERLQTGRWNDLGDEPPPEYRESRTT